MPVGASSPATESVVEPASAAARVCQQDERPEHPQAAGTMAPASQAATQSPPAVRRQRALRCRCRNSTGRPSGEPDAVSPTERTLAGRRSAANALAGRRLAANALAAKRSGERGSCSDSTKAPAGRLPPRGSGRPQPRATRTSAWPVFQVGNKTAATKKQWHQAAALQRPAGRMTASRFTASGDAASGETKSACLEAEGTRTDVGLGRSAAPADDATGCSCRFGDSRRLRRPVCRNIPTAGQCSRSHDGPRAQFV